MNLMFEDFKERRNLINCDDMTKGGQPRFQVSPMINTMCRMKFQSDLIKHTDDNFLIATGVNGSIANWAKGSFLSEKSMFDYLSDNYLKKLRDGTAMFLADFSLEGYHVDWLFDWFHAEAKRLHIPDQCIVYVTGNMLIAEQYEEYADMRGIEDRIKCIPYAGFEEFISVTRQKSKQYTIDEDILFKEQNKTWTFNCPQKRARKHRTEFFDKLIENNLLERGLCSFPDRNVYILGEKHTEDWNHYIGRTHPEYCLKTFVTVVSEPQFYAEDLSTFTSEKVFKPIAMGHPFIVLGGQRSLEVLKSRGYKTFSDYWDESYDTLPDNQRMDAIIELLKYIDSIENKVEWYKSLRPVLEHNLDQFKENCSKEDIAITELKNYYQEYFYDHKIHQLEYFYD